MAKTRLEKAIARASRRRARRSVPTDEIHLVHRDDLRSRAQHRTGEFPDEMIPVVRNELRIAERRSTASQKAAQAAGRKPNEGERSINTR